MLIKLQDIQKLFHDYQSKILVNSIPNHCLCGFYKLGNQEFPYIQHYLYVTESWAHILNRNDIEKHFFLVLENEQNPAPKAELIPNRGNILVLQTEDLTAVIQKLFAYFNFQCGKGLFAESLLDLLFSDNSIQNIIDRAFPVFQNPIYVFDASFELIAANWDEAQKYLSENGSQLLVTKHFSEREFNIINKLENIHERLKKSDAPILIHQDNLPYDQMLCIIDTKKDVGHIVIDGINKPFTNEDLEYMMILKKAIHQQLQKNEFIRNNRGFHYEYFLKDLLDGKITTLKQHYEYFQYVDNNFKGTLYCIVVESARSSCTLNKQHIRNEFEITFPGCKTLLYNGEIIIIIQNSSPSGWEKEDYEKAANICRKHHIFAGISNKFQNITNILNYYKQALRAIEIGIPMHNEPDLFIYESYYLEHMLHIFKQKENPSVFCHPDLKILMEYDKKHDSDLSRTLYMYLRNERNYSATADAMFIHRNTILYRLKKIDSLVQIDYDNYEERQYIILSYELNQSDF